MGRQSVRIETGRIVSGRVYILGVSFLGALLLDGSTLCAYRFWAHGFCMGRVCGRDYILGARISRGSGAVLGSHSAAGLGGWTRPGEGADGFAERRKKS